MNDLGDDQWEEEKDLYDKFVSTVEPFTESLPSLMILTSIWVIETKVKGDDSFQK